MTRRNTSAAVSHPSSGIRARATVGQTRPVTSTGRFSTGNPSSREKDKSVSESLKPVARKKALSPPTTPTPKLLPATPVRRSEKAHLAATRNRPKSMILTTGSATHEDGNDKTSPNTTTVSKESPPVSTATDDGKVENSSNDSPTSVPELPDNAQSCQSNPISDENSNEGGSDHEKLSLPQQGTSGAEKKPKHTIAYRDTSPLYKDGELFNVYTRCSRV